MTASKILAVVAGLALATAVGCSKDKTDGAAASASAPAPPPQHLPEPYAAVRVGMPAAELAKLFPPTEPTEACVTRLVGRRKAQPTVPGEDSKARSRCPVVGEIGGITRAEALALVGVNDTAATEGLVTSVSQLRASVRAGTVPEALVLDAMSTGKTTSLETVVPAVAALHDGTERFLKISSGRRSMCATISDDCGGFDPELVHRFVTGGYTLAQLDADAHSRVVYGKCRAAYLSQEKDLIKIFLIHSGAIGAVGIARAARGKEGISLDDPKSYALFTQLTAVPASSAKLAVAVVLALPETEAYWKGAITLAQPAPAEGKTEIWGEALVWLTDGKVSRVLVNIMDAAKAGELAPALTKVYGPGSPAGKVTTWKLADGVEARLDLSTIAALIVERPGQAPRPPAAVPAATATASASASASASAEPSAEPAATASAAPATTTAVTGAGPGPGAAPPARPKVDRQACLSKCVAGCSDDAACERSCASSKCQ